MSDDGEADKAIAALNGKDVEGRTLTVNEARPKTDRPSGGGGWRKRW
jgi:cold-inducible RNA-binding protein